MPCAPAKSFFKIKYLNMCVSGTPGYVPPVANFDGESTDGIILSSTVPLNKAKKGNHTPYPILFIKPNTLDMEKKALA